MMHLTQQLISMGKTPEFLIIFFMLLMALVLEINKVIIVTLI